MKQKKNPVRSTVPFNENGIHHGHLRLPYSRNDSAWGSVMIPVTVVRNGSGPTALLTGANHGDEYEGPIALQQLAANISLEEVTGLIIIIPAFNYPAFRAGTRTSPIDGINLNRAFPGKPDGTVTEKIADYFQNTLVPMADVVLDFHSGGKTLDFIPFAAIHRLDNTEQQARCDAAMRAFNAPYSMVMLEIDNTGLFDTAVEAQGKVFVSTELGGGGTTTANSVAIARKGVRNLLIHAGILAGELSIGPTIDIDMPAQDCFVFAEDEGLIEFLVNLGDQVNSGDVIARVWPLDKTGAAPVEYHALRDGLLVSRHFPGLLQMGDCVAVVADLI
ncbi:MAG: N(2)-acetyl-L-2,4-diaminobutanoate deacetylase DoeB [Granulosicoccus sp.]